MTAFSGDRSGQGAASTEAVAVTAQELAASCQGMVRTIAWTIHKRLPPYVELDDLIAYGQVGLAQASKEYDLTRGAQFGTYAYYRIRGAILDGLSEMTWFRRSDYHARRFEQLGNDVLEEQAGPGGEGSPAAWLATTASMLAVVHLANELPDVESTLSGEDAVTEPAEVVGRRELCQRLIDAIESLPQDAKILVRAVYYEGLTIKEAGQRLGISKAWASRLHARVLQRLATMLRQLGVTDD